MADYAEKNQENISQTKTSSVYQNKSNEDTTLQLADNRQEVVDQKELQETINSSPMAMQLKDFQDMADSYTSKIEQPIQKKENETRQDKRLQHEAWYVVQQKQERKPIRQMKSKIGINDDVALEKEADVMGAKALQSKKFENIENPSYADKEM